MADRTVSVRLLAIVSDYMTKVSAAGKAIGDLANKVDTAKGRSAQGFQTIGRAAMLGGAAVVAGFGLAVHEMATFESKMALVRTLSHASAAEMKQLHDAALTVGQAYGFSATQVADAEAELVKAGVSVKDIMGGALTGALTLAAAGQTDVAAATETAAIAMTQFKLTGKDVPHIADLLAAGADKALGSVGDLSYALQSGGLVAAQFGLTIDDTIGTLSAFAQAGLIGERGGTTLRQMLLKLSAPGKEAADTLDRLGISLYNSNGQFVGITNLAGQLHDKLATLTPAVRNQALAVVFGSRAITAANILYNEGAKGIQGWINRVNDSGFAALQASGKMDSLSGDVTKLKSALQAAFIGVGEGANGPLRSLVQDVTGVIDVWNGLPGPVRTGAEALAFAGGTLTFVGGAALMFIPKWTAMNAALVASGRSAVTARGALGALGKGAGAIVLLGGLYEGAKALGNVLADDTSPSVNQFTAALVNMANSTDPSAAGLVQFASFVGKLGDQFGIAAKMTTNLDAALAGLVTQGKADQAASDFMQMSDALHRSGMSTAEITRLFPQYARALSDSSTSAKVAGSGIDQYGNAVSDAAKKTDAATKAAKAYSDQLHAMADPLFAMNKALQDVATAQATASNAAAGPRSKEARDAHKRLLDQQRQLNDAQRAYNDLGKHSTHATRVDAQRRVAAATRDVTTAQREYDQAVRDHAAKSKGARQAELDLASAALDASTAAASLTTAVATGAVSLSAARTQLREWVKGGLLTKHQADDVARSFDGLITKADKLSALHPSITVTANVGRAISSLNVLDDWLHKIHSKRLDVTVRENILLSGPGRTARVGGFADGGLVTGPGTSTSDSVLARVSAGEWVVKADGSNLAAAARHFGRWQPARHSSVTNDNRENNVRVVINVDHIDGANADQVIDRIGKKVRLAALGG